MTPNFNKFISICLESKNSDDIDSEKMRKANEYFSIGHQGDMDDYGDDDGTLDHCWIWFDGGLKVGSGRTHNQTFGSEIVDRARFKGWYDTGKQVISFVDMRQMINSVEEIPQRVYDHLLRRFKTKNIKVF